MKISTEERFWSKVQSTFAGECWLWTASVDRDGYGKFGKLEGGWVRAHRWSYEHLVGRPIPDGLVIDHLCRVPNCVNPEHMEPVTIRENTLRGVSSGGGGERKKKTHCKRGHPFTPENTYIYPNKLARECLTCKRGHRRGLYAKEAVSP